MKKISIILIAFLCVSGVFSQVSAQKARFGHVDYAALIQAMPETEAAQQQVIALKDSLENEAKDMQAEFETKYNEFMQKQSSYSQAVAQVKQKEVEDLYKRLQDFSTSAESKLMARQSELLAPIQEKVLNAIKEVAKAQGYTYVFDLSTPLFVSDTEDITNPVKAKLGVK
ncbi:MAG: OmpH family outer membrane protein [Bacteroidales bacterium]|nr:OmpH family outer membrane protein [Bacteroidales bacterium]